MNTKTQKLNSSKNDGDKFLKSVKGPKSDRKWFNKNPNRSYRMRWAVRDEIDKAVTAESIDDFFLAVLVKQFWPGYRQRVRIFWSGELPSDEAQIAELYNWATSQEALSELNLPVEQRTRVGWRK